MPISRLYPTEEAARRVVAALEEAGFKTSRMQVVGPASPHPTAADLVRRGIAPPNAPAYLHRIKAGETLLIFDAPYGAARRGQAILDRSGGSEAAGTEASSANAVFEGTDWNDAAPLSSALGWKTLSSDATPLSSFLHLPTLTRHQSPSRSSFLLPLLSHASAPLSKLFGLKTLSANAAPLSSLTGMKTLSANAAPLSHATGLPVLSRNATPLSSALGMPVLSDNAAPLSSAVSAPTLTDDSGA